MSKSHPRHSSNRALWHRAITAGIQPSLSGDKILRRSGDPAESNRAAPSIVYVQRGQSLTDALIVDKAIASIRNEEQAGWPNSPLEPLAFDTWQLPTSTIALAKRFAGRVTMRKVPTQLTQLIETPVSVQANVTIVPVCVFWGRSWSPKDSFLRSLTSEQRSTTAGFKRLLGLIFNRGDVHVCFGKPVSLAELANHQRGADFAVRRAARLLRMRFKAMEFVTLGPDQSHRRTLLNQVVRANRVSKTIATLHAENAADRSLSQANLDKNALKIARTIASDLTYSTIRGFLIFLSWFWRRIYDGVNVQGLDALRALNETHTLVYVPTHRSHIDYLVLSYSLYMNGIMLPHIAAGDNLNMPVLGRLLRQGGAFFMRRSFRDDPLYTAVFEEYLYRVLSNGYSVEFFPEGGRSRSGRLLAPKFGLLKLCLENQRRGLPKPLAFVPIYFGYEKVVESGSYLSELRGSAKRQERLMDLFTNIQVIRQHFGRLQVNLAPAIKLDEWLQQADITHQSADRQLEELGQAIMQRINRQASVNPVNLVALAITHRTHLTLQEHTLTNQVECYRTLSLALYGDGILTDNVEGAGSVIRQVAALGFIDRDPEEAWITCSPGAATLLTWYRNNVLHLFALPALIALLISRSTGGLAERALIEQVALIYPYVAQELTTDPEPNISAALDALEAQGLIRRNGQMLLPPNKPSEAYEQLAQLASSILEMLQRMYVVVCIATQRPLTADELKSHSLATAKKLARLLGITGAEFSEDRLFDAFLDRLLAAHHMTRNERGHLVASPLMHQVAERAAEQIIEPSVHLALQRVIQSSLGDITQPQDTHQNEHSSP